MAAATTFALVAFFTTSLFNGATLAAPTAIASNSSVAANPPPVKLESFTGPLLPVSMRDPCILEAGGTYYTYSTNTGKNSKNYRNVPVTMSTTSSITGPWKNLPDFDALSKGTGKWTVNPDGGPETSVWNPDVSKLDDGTFVMYYSAKRSGSNNERCIGVAHSKSPTEAFTPKDNALYCPKSGGAIGVDGIKDGNRRYVLFKDGSHQQAGAGPHIALLEVDYDTGSKAIGDPHLITTEKGLKYGYEGPALTKMPNGKWLLLHTTGQDRSTYQIVYATADTITQQYYNEGGVLISSPDTSGSTKVYIPGGPDFVGSSNTDIIFFASPTDPKEGTATKLYYGKLSYT